MKKMWLAFLLPLLIVSVGALQFGYSDIGTVKSADCISLTQTCANCTYMNVTSIIYPNKTKEITNYTMARSGSEFTYSNFCKTAAIGTYYYNTLGNPSGVAVNEPVQFEVTPTGMKDNTNSGIIGAFVLIMLLGMAATLLFFSNRWAGMPHAWIFGFIGIAVGMLLLYLDVLMASIYLRDLAYTTSTADNMSGLFVMGARAIKYMPYLFVATCIYWLYKRTKTRKKAILDSDGWDDNKY